MDKNGQSVIILVFVFFFLLMLAAVLVSIQVILFTEYKIIEGKIIESDYNIDKNYLEVTFDNGESYRLSFDYNNYYVDLTVNSKLILKLYKASCFLIPNADNVWTVDKIIKVPDG